MGTEEIDVLLIMKVPCIFIALTAPCLWCINLTVHEGTSNYISTLKTLAGEEDVINHVPGHVRDGKLYEEHTKIENMDLGVSVWKGAGDQMCLFRNMMEYETPPLLVSIAQDFEKRQVAIDNANITQVLLWATPDREMNEQEREDLSVAMQLLCDGIPILKMNTEVVTSDVFETRIENAEECYTSKSGLYGRRKRSPGRLDISAHRKCNHCAGGNPYKFAAQQLKLRQGNRRRRSSGNTEEDMKHLVHLIIGHLDIGCEE